jgi:hypothetical protein
MQMPRTCTQELTDAIAAAIGSIELGGQPDRAELETTLAAFAEDILHQARCVVLKQPVVVNQPPVVPLPAVRLPPKELPETCPTCKAQVDPEHPERHCPNDAWDEVIGTLERAWPGRPAALCYSESPCELIAKLIDERDDAKHQYEVRSTAIIDLTRERDDLAKIVEAIRKDITRG